VVRHGGHFTDTDRPVRSFLPVSSGESRNARPLTGVGRGDNTATSTEGSA
jgi:hypothetical protein